MSFDEKLTLQNINGGKLAKEFERIYPQLISTMKEGDKASMTIKLDFERVSGTDTMVKVVSSVSHKAPPKKILGVCQLNDDFELLTDKPEDPPENITLFSNYKEAKEAK